MSIFDRLVYIENNVILIENDGMKILEYSEVSNKFKKSKLVDLYLLGEFSNMLMRKGKASKYFKHLVNGLMLVRRYFNIDPMLLIRSIIVKSEACFTLDKYIFGRREKLMPRFSNLRRSVRYVLRMILKGVILGGRSDIKLSVRVADSVVEYFLEENKLELENKENNELARINKYSIFNRKRKRRRYKLYRVVDSWK